MQLGVACEHHLSDVGNWLDRLDEHLACQLGAALIKVKEAHVRPRKGHRPPLRARDELELELAHGEHGVPHRLRLRVDAAWPKQVDEGKRLGRGLIGRATLDAIPLLDPMAVLGGVGDAQVDRLTTARAVERAHRVDAHVAEQHLMGRRVSRHLVAHIKASNAALAIEATEVAVDDSGILKAETNKAITWRAARSLQLTALCWGMLRDVPCALDKISLTDRGQCYEQ